MRTLSKFNVAYEELMWFTKFHDKHAWLVPTEDNYFASVIQPQADELPSGTASNLYDKHGNIHQTIVSSIK